jgi:hypothetical protein
MSWEELFDEIDETDPIVEPRARAAGHRARVEVV